MPGDLEASFAKHLALIGEARAAGVDVLLFPELSLTGHAGGEAALELARERAHPLVAALAAAAGDMYTKFGMIEEGPAAQFYNTVVTVHAGDPVFVQRKVKLATYGRLEEGKHYASGRYVETLRLDVHDCMQDTLHCRRIKMPEEIACLAQSAAGTEAAVFEVEQAIRPGVTENDLFATLYGNVIKQGGEFIETRLLTSGPRTNPWFNEASDRVVRAGELIALDTDTIGCHGYYCDFSRTFHVGPGRPSGYQQSLYGMAFEQIHHNMSLLRPGLAYRELAERAWKIPARFLDRRYPSIIHGVGLHGETPLVAHHMDFETFSSDGVLEPGMVVSVESYIGEVDAADGVKLEEQVLITETGIAKMSTYPYDEGLLGRQV